jgi:hypothetical protein
VRLSLFGIAPNPKAMIFTRYGESTIPNRTTIMTIMSKILNTLLARRFCCSLPLFFSAVKIGIKAAESAVSAKRSRKRFGIRNAALKASVEKPAPKR